VLDRIIAKACANASDSRGRADAVEKTLYLHQARGLGFCKQALSGPKTVLGTGDLAQMLLPDRWLSGGNDDAIPSQWDISLDCIHSRPQAELFAKDSIPRSFTVLKRDCRFA
jgi:hypothetical protein